MKFKLADLIDIEKNQELLDSFCDAVGIAAAIIDLQGEVLVGSRWERICTDFHRINEQTCAKCIESDTQLANELNSGKQFSIYSCKNGLTDAASPIVIEDEHVANVFVGQFLMEPPDQEFFRRQAANYGFEEASYLDALTKVPIVSKKKLPAILDFITSFAEMVATMGLKQIRALEAEEALSQRNDELSALTSRVFSELPHSIEIIENEVKGIESAGEHVERLATIKDKLNATKLLISNTFAFLTSEIKAAKPSTVSVSMAIHEAKEQLGGVITRTKANISYDSLPVVNFDQQKLVFLLSALLDNSIKFQDNNTPNINISAEEKEDSWLFAVQDNGIGIDSYFLERGIFELFCRSQNAVRYPGIGIGLATSKRIVESNGGRIWIESERGKGTTAFFTVPKR